MNEDFSGVNLSGVIFPGADLSGIKLSEAVISEAILTKAVLVNADLMGADLSWSKLVEADLSEADLSGANLTGADLSWANVKKANFSGANLHRANLSNANLQEADLRSSKLSKTDLSGANLTGAKLYGIILAGSKLDDVMCEWYDYSLAGDGSDIRRSFEELVSALKTQIIVTSNTELNSRLLGGLAGLAKLMQAVGVKVSKIEGASGNSTVTFEAAKEEDLIPAAIILFNTLIKCNKIDLEALYSDMPYLKEMVIDNRLLIDVFKELLGPMDSSKLHYNLLDNFRRDFACMTANIQGELVSINRQDEKLHIDCRQSADPNKGPAPDAAKPSTSLAIANIIKWLLTH